jgi:hypothetical protein
MSDRRLPVRPDLEQLKHQAKDLLHAIRDGERLHPGMGRTPCTSIVTSRRCRGVSDSIARCS